jgi:hypothetical protein
MASWKYDTCALCTGKGKAQGKKCPVCNGYGYWEFIEDNNHLAVKTLQTGQIFEGEVKELCDRRMNQLTPDNMQAVLQDLSGGTEEDFNAIHKAGAQKWGWAWVHANRFAIELCKLSGGDPTEHCLSLSRLVWIWLEEENQKKVDTPT